MLKWKWIIIINKRIIKWINFTIKKRNPKLLIDARIRRRRKTKLNYSLIRRIRTFRKTKIGFRNSNQIIRWKITRIIFIIIRNYQRLSIINRRIWANNLKISSKYINYFIN